MVHGDDFTLLGSDENLNWFKEETMNRFEVKVRGRLGPGPTDAKAISILNRIVEWTNKGLWYEVDQRHAEICVEDLDRINHKVRCEVPGERAPYEEEDEEPLPAHEVKRYQALVARANYLAQDRSDIQFSVKELARSMSSPTRGSWQGLLKLGKYLKNHCLSGHS